MGKSVQLKATITPEDASNKKVSWRVGNPQIASVDANGEGNSKIHREYICVCRNSEWIESKMHNPCYSEGNQADRNQIK